MDAHLVEVIQKASAVLGGLYALTILVNLFNPLIALRWPRLAAVLSTMGGHLADARNELQVIAASRRVAKAVEASGRKAPSVPPLPVLAFAALMTACTPAAQSAVQTGIQVVEAGCVALVSVEAPGSQPLCVFGAELAEALAAYFAAHGAAAPVTTNATGQTVVPAEVHAYLAAKAEIKARKAKPAPCGKGIVSP